MSSTGQAQASTPPEDFAANMFNRPLQAVEVCYAQREACEKCYTQCASAHDTYFSGATLSPGTLISLTHECRTQISNHRTGMEPWCVNDWTRFFATSDFKASAESCEMEGTECARRMVEWARRRHSSGSLQTQHNDYRLAEQIGITGKAIEYMQLSKAWYHGQVNKYERLEEWWDEDILIEMDTHLKTPHSNNTRFSDPVFHNLTAMTDETRRVDKYLYRNDLLSARVENKFVRQDIMQKVPQYLESIKTLQNHIQSNKEQTDTYLSEIKNLVIKTYEAQEKATNFAYETTHADGLDGDIVLLDKELLDMFAELQKERTLLIEANRKSTLNKLRLTGAMRHLVSQLTKAQRQVGCSDDEVFASHTS